VDREIVNAVGFESTKTTASIVEGDW